MGGIQFSVFRKFVEIKVNFVSQEGNVDTF